MALCRCVWLSGLVQVYVRGIQGTSRPTGLQLANRGAFVGRDTNFSDCLDQDGNGSYLC
jgi:hypothetical protein